MKQIKDYLQTQALQLDVEETAAARAAAQASLPVCGEDGIVYGVLHLETAEPLPPAELAAWTGLTLGVLPVLRNLLPRETASENDAA